MSGNGREPADGPGWVRSYKVQDDRSVLLTCFHPAHGEDIMIRVLPIELDTMLRSARKVTTPCTSTSSGSRTTPRR